MTATVEQDNRRNKPAPQAPTPPAATGSPGYAAAKPGDVVWFWHGLGGEMKCIPAMLLRPGDKPGAWHLNRLEFSRLMGLHNVAYSDTPKFNCWTWPKAGT